MRQSSPGPAACSSSARPAARRSPTTAAAARRRESRSWRRSTRWSSSPSGSAATTSRSTNLTQPGGEPHDLELTIKETAEIADADLVRLRGRLPAGRRRGGRRRTPRARCSTRPTWSTCGTSRTSTSTPTRARRARPRRPGPALLAGPAAAGRRSADAVADAAGRRSTPTTPTTTPPTPPTCAPTSSSSTRSTPTGWRTATRDTVVVTHDAFGYLGDATACTRGDRRPLPRRRADAAPTSAELQELIRRRRHHHRLLRAAGQPASSPRPSPTTSGVDHRRARPDRGADRRDRRRGLPFA